MTPAPDRLPYRVRFGSRIPRLFGRDAVTLRRTIHVRKHSITPRLLAHEYCHVEQWAREGAVKFLCKYLWYQVRWGYHSNPYEHAAHLYATAHAHEFRGVP